MTTRSRIGGMGVKSLSGSPLGTAREARAGNGVFSLKKLKGSRQSPPNDLSSPW